MQESGLFTVDEPVTVAWVRELGVAVWLADECGKSYGSVLPEPDRLARLCELETFARGRSPSGDTRVPYETWRWIAKKR
ncbi:MAG: hypothetical protein ACLPVY_23150 [Acidimicrobiia bacterium]